MGVEDTYIHSDVNYPLWHRLIQEHRLGLTSGVPAEQPKHTHQAVSGPATQVTRPRLRTLDGGTRPLEFTQDSLHSVGETERSLAERLAQLRQSAGPRARAPGSEARHTPELPLPVPRDDGKPAQGKALKKGPCQCHGAQHRPPCPTGQDVSSNHPLRKPSQRKKVCAEGKTSILQSYSLQKALVSSPLTPQGLAGSVEAKPA